MTSLDITFTVTDPLEGCAPQFVCEMQPLGWDQEAPALIQTETYLN